MPCYVCGGDPADYTCESCKKQACYSHARSVGKSVFCVGCVKSTKPPKVEKNMAESAFVYSLVFTVGLVAIFLVGEYAIFGMLETYSGLLPDSVKSLVTFLRSVSVLLVGGSIAVTTLLFLLSRKKTKQIPANS
ncbi:MAG: hypothetical protein HY516_03220 [Candidatus Aenigmarchaeota archaeon]|nr:hypothetical protein [Candidatus Aenigmarchaeota archaeon]